MVLYCEALLVRLAILLILVKSPVLNKLSRVCFPRVKVGKYYLLS